MTREEAIEVLKLVEENASCDDCLYYAQMEDCPTDEDCIIVQAIRMAKQALSQEQKSGKWIEKDFRKEEYVLTGKCSVCGRVRILDKFCSYCGAKMEREDKEC